MEYKELSKEQNEELIKAIPEGFLKVHPSKKFLTVIKPIAITERLNSVFGRGGWSLKTEVIEKVDKMVVIKGTLVIEMHGISIEQFGGNDNPDLGDAYKGATTDALGKCASYLGIGREIYSK